MFHLFFYGYFSDTYPSRIRRASVSDTYRIRNSHLLWSIGVTQISSIAATQYMQLPIIYNVYVFSLYKQYSVMENSFCLLFQEHSMLTFIACIYSIIKLLVACHFDMFFLKSLIDLLPKLVMNGEYHLCNNLVTRKAS